MPQETSERGRGGARAQRGTSAKATADLNLDRLFNEMEGRARAWLESASTWVNRGDELLGKTKSWLDEHPVALAMATKYARRAEFLPRSGAEARQGVRNIRQAAGTTARRGMTAARANPAQALLVAGAVGVLSWAALRARA